MKYINDFIKYIKNIRNYSENTVINYELDLKEYLEYLNKKKLTLIDITYKEVKQYLSYLYDKNYSNSSLSRKISTLRSFYKYLYNESLIKKNPYLYVSLPKKEKKLPRYVNYEDLDLILSIPDLETKNGIRDRLILEILYGTGIRVSELCNIEFKDVDLREKTIRIVGKGDKERIVLYGEYCSEILDKYLKVRDIKEKKLIQSNTGNKINASSVQKILKDILKKASLKKNITPHVFRHTFATHLLNEGCDILTVKELLGHSSLDTTQIYTHVSNEKLRKVYLDTHPRSKKK